MLCLKNMCSKAKHLRSIYFEGNVYPSHIYLAVFIRKLKFNFELTISPFLNVQYGKLTSNDDRKNIAKHVM